MGNNPPGPRDPTDITGPGAGECNGERGVPYLLVLTGLSAGCIFRLEGELTIGRADDAQIRLLEVDVSRTHARIKVSDQAVVIEDAGSRNGTKVNGQRLSAPCALAHGDMIAIASASVLTLRLHDGTDQKFQRAMEERAWRDEMTGAHKREYFEARLAKDLESARSQNVRLALVMIDVDRLGQLNEKWGRIIGDMTLARLTRRIARHLRDDDLLARFAGGTFVVVCRQTDANQALALAERLRKRISKNPYPVVGDAILMTVSIGIGTFPAGGVDGPADLVAAAARALSRAKASGPDRVAVSDK